MANRPRPRRIFRFVLLVVAIVMAGGVAGIVPSNFASKATAQGGLIKSFGDVREDEVGEVIAAPKKRECPYERLRPITTRCPACQEDADHVNTIRTRITELNKRIAEVTCELEELDAGGPKVAEKPDACPDGKPLGWGTKYRLGMTYRGEAGQKMKWYESAAIYSGNVGRWSHDIETFSSFANMMTTINTKVPPPIDRTAQCGNCIGHLTIYQHGQFSDKIQPDGSKKSIASGVVSIGDVQIDGSYSRNFDPVTGGLSRTGVIGKVNKPNIKALRRLKRYMCTDSTLSFITCSQASVKGGQTAGKAIATELGVPVMLPDFAVSVGACPPKAGTEMSGWEQYDPYVPPPSTEPTAEERRKQARLAFLAQLRRHKASAETILAAATGRLLACEHECLLSKDAKALGELLSGLLTTTKVEQVHHRTGDNFFDPRYDPVEAERGGTRVTTGGTGTGGTGTGTGGTGTGGTGTGTGGTGTGTGGTGTGGTGTGGTGTGGTGTGTGGTGTGGTGTGGTGGTGGGPSNSFGALNGPLNGNGGCGFSSTILSTSGPGTTLTLGPNGVVSFPNSGGGNGTSTSSNLIVFGAPGHTCSISFLSVPGNNQVLLTCRNTGGGSCGEPFAR